MHLIHDRIKEERERLGLTQQEVADCAGVTKRTVIGWEKGDSSPTGVQLFALMECGVDSGYVVTSQRGGKTNIPRPGFISVPQYEVAASAGNGHAVHDENVIGFLEVSRDWVRNVIHAEPGKLAIISVDGDSMEPNLKHGEQVLLDLRRNRFDNDAVYAIQIGGWLRIKRVQTLHNGNVVIKSDNPAFEPETLTADEAADLHVIGRVLPWKFGKFKL